MRLSKIRLLTLTQLAGVSDVLLHSGDLGADLVVTALDSRYAIALLRMKGALLFDRGFGGALISQRRLHRQLALAHRTVVHFKAAIEIAQSQGEQLGGQPALLVLETLVATRGRGLSLQVPDLLFNLIAHILQALEILACLGDAAFRLLAALLVTGDARGLLDERAHVIGLGLDDARNHALLDDRVAARSEAGAQKEIGDVLAAAARGIDEIAGRAVARNLALQRHLVVVRVHAAESCRRSCRTRAPRTRCQQACARWSR